jgi:hypothetical protein
VPIASNYRYKRLTQVTLSTTPTLVARRDTDRVGLDIENAGNVNVYLGPDASVTSATGMVLPPLSWLEDRESDDDWWGVVASGSGDVRVVEMCE